MKRLMVIVGVFILLLAFTGMVSAAPNGKTAPPPQVRMGIFIDYGQSGGPPSWDDTEDDYQIRAGITWLDPSVVTYYVNAAGSGVSVNETIDAVMAGLAEWEDGPYSHWAVPTGFVAYTYDGETTLAGANRDYMNTVSWHSIDGAGGAIAACYYWYDTRTKTMLEFDIVFDTAEPWGIGAGNHYDIQNIATHEWGHTVVLFDLYPPKDGALTMYGWASQGDTEKRTLGYGDALGVAELYPE